MTYKFGLPQAPMGTVTDVGGSQSTDASTGVCFLATLNPIGANTLNNPTNLQEGQTYTWQLMQDASTPVDVALDSDFYFSGGIGPTITQTAGAVDVLTGTAMDLGSGLKLYCTFEADVKIPPFPNAYGAVFGVPGTSLNTSQYLGGGNVLDKDGSSSFSVSMWLKVAAGAQPLLEFIVTKQLGGPTYGGYQMGYGDSVDSGTLFIGLINNFGTGDYWRYNTNSDALLTDGNWHHVAFVARGTNTAPLIYVDGSPVAISLATGSLFTGSTSTSADLVVCQRQDLTGATNYYYTGHLDELAFFDDELTAGEIGAIYNGGVPTDLTGHDHLEAWWRMGDDASDDFTGTTGQITDVAGSNNLTPYNTTSANRSTDVP